MKRYLILLILLGISVTSLANPKLIVTRAEYENRKSFVEKLAQIEKEYTNGEIQLKSYREKLAQIESEYTNGEIDIGKKCVDRMEKPECLKRVVQNPNLDEDLQKCDQVKNGQDCFLYILNDEDRPIKVQDFFDKAAKLTHRLQFDIADMNDEYAFDEIPSGFFAQIRIPAEGKTIEPQKRDEAIILRFVQEYLMTRYTILPDLKRQEDLWGLKGMVYKGSTDNVYEEFHQREVIPSWTLAKETLFTRSVTIENIEKLEKTGSYKAILKFEDTQDTPTNKSIRYFEMLVRVCNFKLKVCKISLRPIKK